MTTASAKSVALVRIHTVLCLFVILASLYAIHRINAYYDARQQADRCRYLGELLSRELHLPNAAALIEDRCNKQK